MEKRFKTVLVEIHRKLVEEEDFEWRNADAFLADVLTDEEWSDFSDEVSE